MAQSSDGSLHFFRIFDLAFFAPGATILGAMWWYRVIDARQLRLCELGGETTQGVALLIAAALLSYVIGLACHAVHRVLTSVLGTWRKSLRCSDCDPSWYANLKSDARQELALYFWYKRSTCWNMAVAVIVVWAIRSQSCGVCCSWLPALLICAAFVWLGQDFDRALHRAADRPLADNPGPACKRCGQTPRV